MLEHRAEHHEIEVTDIGRQPVDNARQSDFDTASGFIDARQALRSTPDL